MATASELAASWLKSGGAQSSTPSTPATDSPAGLDMVSNEEMSSATEDDDSSVNAENSTLDDLIPGDSEDTPSDSSETQDKAVAAKSEKPTEKTSTKEIITVTDEQGRKRKVEIDYSDKESVKKAHLMAAGARKWQAERDQALQGRKNLEQELTKVKGDWNSLDQAYQQGGVEGLFDLINGPGAFKSHIAKQIERAEFLKSASPEQVQALQEREAQEQLRKDLEKERLDNRKFKEEMKGEREQAETRAMESRIHPVFEKYRFADKLGDPNDEHIFDEMLWRTSMDRLEKYEEQGVEITPELVNKEFSSVAQRIRSRINVQAEKKTARNVEQKKREATENVQAKVMSGYKTGGNAKEARDLINNGNLTSLLKGWGKYGNLFQPGSKK